MAKRFVDTERHRKMLRGIDPKHRVAFEFIWQNCDAAGVWVVDLELFRFECGFKLNIQGLLKTCPSLQMLPDGALFHTDFVEVNYGKLKPGYNPHKPVFRSLQAHGLDPDHLPIQDLPNPSRRVEGEDEEEGSGKKERAGAPPPRPKGPDPNVQAVIDHLAAALKFHTIAPSLDPEPIVKDGKTFDGNRFAAATLLQKLATDYPDHDPLECAKLLINAAMEDPFHKIHSTKVRYLLNNCGKIAAGARARSTDPKNQTSQDRDQQFADAVQRRAADRAATA